ncbi:MAG: hypothetical protein IKL98_02565, partial [Akkermansia sp.]|nr:hypothetical protein [Akkermansia sp.]
MVKILQYLRIGRCTWATLATGLVVLFAGCAQPLLPPARIPRMERTKLPDEQLLTLLQQDWELLKNRKLTAEARAKVVARYNQNAYLMMRRY